MKRIEVLEARLAAQYPPPFWGALPQGIVSLTSFNSWTGVQRFAAPIQFVNTQSGISMNIETLTAGRQLLSSDWVVFCNASSGPMTVTLPPSASFAAAWYIIVKVDSSGNAVTIVPSGSDTIQGAGSKTLASQYQKTNLVNDGVSVWYDLVANLV